MSWRLALGVGALIEALIVTALALYVSGVMPPAVFGGVPLPSAAFALHLPGSLLTFPLLGATNAFRLGLAPSLLVTAVVVGAAQVAFIGTLAFAAARCPRTSAAVLALLAVGAVAYQSRPPYPAGLDANRDRRVTMDEWVAFHAEEPMFYGGYDKDGYITEGSPDYYEREFKRVDCNEDSEMDAYEYGQLRWNMRWCESTLRPPRPWWR